MNAIVIPVRAQLTACKQIPVVCVRVCVCGGGGGGGGDVSRIVSCALKISTSNA